MTDIDIDRMSLAQTRAAAQELLDSTTGDLAGSDAERFQALTRRANDIREQEQNRATAARDMVQRLAAGDPGLMLEGEGSGVSRYHRADEDRPQAVQNRDAAMRVLERAVSTDRVNARGAEIVEKVMSSGSPLAQTWTQRWAIATGAEAYERAFAKKLADYDNGHLSWTAEESDAWRAVIQVQAEQRAMSLTDSAGGFLVPWTLDPSVNITSNGSTNPLRQVSTVTQIVTDAWNGITSAGVTAEWIAEASEVADASPTVAQPSIPVHKCDAFVGFSFEIGMDGQNFMGELQKLLIDGYDQLTAQAYTTGSGVGQPTGLITRLVASSGTVALVAPAVAETFSAADIYATQNALPPRFQPRASWNAALATINAARQFESSNGAIRFPELAANPPMLLGRPIYENSNMDGSINAAATENNYNLVYGDFAAGFRIIDRLGSTLEIVPHLFGSSRRPNGQRGALLWARTGSDVVMPQAFRLLSIPTTA